MALSSSPREATTGSLRSRRQVHGAAFARRLPNRDTLISDSNNNRTVEGKWSDRILRLRLCFARKLAQTSPSKPPLLRGFMPTSCVRDRNQCEACAHHPRFRNAKLWRIDKIVCRIDPLYRCRDPVQMWTGIGVAARIDIVLLLEERPEIKTPKMAGSAWPCFLVSRFRAKILAYSMRSRSTISAKEMPLLKRFRHGRPDRGRRSSC